MAKSVLVVGDVISDDYIYVKTVRDASEAPIPVWDEVKRESRPGGAWNVARNIQTMGSELDVYLAGILSPSRWSRREGEEDRATFCFGGDPLTKTRYVSGADRIIFRHDDRLKFDPVESELLLENINGKVGTRRFDAVVFSDYDKGTLTADMIHFCKSLSDLIVIDSKRRDLEVFSRHQVGKTSILKLNEFEYSTQVTVHRDDQYPVEALFDYLVVTKGKEGATLRQFDRVESKINRFAIHSEEFPTKKVWALDVTGCGDTHTAAMTVSLLRDGDIRKAVRFGNEQAAKAVVQFGTVAVW